MSDEASSGATEQVDRAQPDRKFQLQLAALASGSALIGALVGGISSFISTQQQIAAQDKQLVRQMKINGNQAQQVFLRDQRRAIYSKAVLDDDAVTATLNRYRAAVEDSAPRSTIQALRTQTSSRVTVFSGDVVQILILAPDSVVTRATALGSAMLLMSQDLQRLQAVREQHGGDSDVRQATAKLDRATAQFVAASSSMREEMRRNLGVK